VSLVEDALKKLQRTGAAKAAERPVSSTPVNVTVLPSDSQARLRVRKSIAIDRSRLQAAGFFPPEQQERRLADQYRQIKRPIIARAFGRGVAQTPNGHRVVVTSSIPGEGKTFTSVNLALSVAREKDTSALLVDTDIARPQLSRLFGVVDEPGLMDALQDKSIDIESLVLGTNVPGLRLLPVGRSVDNATELLASQRMDEVVARIAAAQPDCLIIFDSPPLLATAESRALAQGAGQIVLVIRAEETPQAKVREAIELLGDKAPVGVVLNQSVEDSQSEYYYGSSAYNNDTSNSTSAKSTASNA
jgi:protein-tyrosine kinase